MLLIASMLAWAFSGSFFSFCNRCRAPLVTNDCRPIGLRANKTSNCKTDTHTHTHTRNRGQQTCCIALACPRHV